MQKTLADFDPLKLEESTEQIIIDGTTFQYILNKSNGLISQIKVLDDTFLFNDVPVPSLYLSSEIDPRTKIHEARYEQASNFDIIEENDEEIVIQCEGHYYDSEGNPFPMIYTILYRVDIDGVIEVVVNNAALDHAAIRWLCFAKGAFKSDLCEYLSYLPDLSTTEDTGHPEVKYLLPEREKQVLAGRFIPWFHFGNDRTGVEVAVCDATNITYGWTDTSPYPTGDPLGKRGENFVSLALEKSVSWDIFSIRNLYTALYPGWERDNTFYLAVVPAKRYNPTHADLRVHWVGPHQYRKNYKHPGDEKLKKLAIEGINLVIGCINYRSGEYSIVDKPEETRRVIETCHKHGLKIIPYVTFVDLNQQTEAFKRHAEDWQIEPVAEFNYRTNLMCYGAEGWREHWKREVDTVIDRFDFDGLYIDFWAGKVACRSPRHGCSTRYMRFNLAGLRDMAKYAYKRLRTKNPALFILANTNVFPCAMINNFIDIRLLGEWWNVEETDPKMIRAFHNAFKFGCNNLLLTGRIGKITQKSVCFSQAYHGPMVMTKSRGRSDEEVDLLLNHANLLRFFGISRAECVNSFFSKDVIDRQPEHLIVSLYKNELGLLLAVANLSPEAVTAHVRLKDPSKMGIKPSGQYLAYRPDIKRLLKGTSFSGNEVSDLTFQLEASSPSLVYITEVPKNPKLLYASNFDCVRDELWGEMGILSFRLKGVEDATGEATIYCPTKFPRQVTVDNKPVEYVTNGKIVHFEVEATRLVEVKF